MWAILNTVNDPEVPVLSIVDLGIVRNVSFETNNDGGSQVKVTITPTYSGCPAMDVIGMQIRLALAENGHKDVKIEMVLACMDNRLDDARRQTKAKRVWNCPAESCAIRLYK